MAEEQEKLNPVEEELSKAFVLCPHCGSNLCYRQDVPSADPTVDMTTATLTCLHCGFTTSDLMLEGSDTERKVSARYPSLYKDLRYKDVHGFVWYPAVVTVPGRGMVYVDGSDTENWEWVATPMRKLSRHERRSGRYGKGQEYISLPNQTKRFGKEGFIAACSHLGIFGQ